MSDFLLITPNDPTWIEMTVENTTILFTQVTEPSTILTYKNDLFNLSLLMRDAGLLTDEETLTDFQLISTGDVDLPFKFWYRV